MFLSSAFNNIPSCERKISFKIEVEFTGEFPEGRIGVIFDFTFKDGKIDKAKAD